MNLVIECETTVCAKTGPKVKVTCD